MSAMIVWRRKDSVLIATDGGHFKSVEDFTITGLVSKVTMLPHISAVFLGCGSSTLNNMIVLNHSDEWTSFDHMVTVIKRNIIDEQYRYARWFPQDDRTFFGVVAIAGWSESRQRFESYLYKADDGQAEDLPAPEFVFAPEPGPQAMRELGLGDGQNVNIDPEHPVRELVRFMTAQRRTPFDTGTDDDPKTGCCVAGFVQITILQREDIATFIAHRWNDEIGKLADPSKDEPLAEPANA